MRDRIRRHSRLPVDVISSSYLTIARGATIVKEIDGIAASMTDRRTALTLLAAAAACPGTPGRAGEIAGGGMRLVWRHAGGRLHAELSAPTRGWIAAGFGATPDLRGLRFVIAATATPPIRVEEHLALVPEHKPVQELGLAPAIADIAGGHDGARSWLRFSLPQRSADGSLPGLGPGARIWTMLAWSHEADFDHHSAFRGHVETTL
jgi:hypothetical protein